MANKTSYVYQNKWFKHRKVIPETVGQYTGLEDKNGVRIFEGDVLRIAIGGCTQRSPYLVEIPEVFTELRRDDHYYQIDWDTTEVIGNIHDNPELLGGKQWK